jgi:hypothetical protein
MKLSERFTACLFISLINCAGFTQSTTAGLHGMIRAAGGEKLSGAVIRVVYEPGGTAFFTQSNRQGLYHLDDLQAGGPIRSKFPSSVLVQKKDPALNCCWVTECCLM